MADIAEVTDLSKSDASILLRYYQWNKRLLQEEWFDDPDRVRAKAGLMEHDVSDVSTPSSTLVCPICWNNFPKRDMLSLKCGHKSCQQCWIDYMEDEISKGIQCVTSKCPYHGCVEAIPEDFFDRIMKSRPKSLNRYKEYLLKAFVDYNKLIVWCPAPECENAIECPGGGTGVDIKCSCSTWFCFTCKEEAHRPASCENTRNWLVKNSAESENITWIKAHTKPCPKCRNNIEKNQGCNHMTCRKEVGGCGHEFCWMCMGDWKEHGSASGGYYKCNRYDENKVDSSTKEMENNAKKAKNELEKYMHYFDRFNNHEQARKFGKERLRAINADIEYFQENKGVKIGEIMFLRDAAHQIIDCRRVLKWTYTFAYYVTDGAEKRLFEFLQEDLEKNTDYLQGLIEKDLKPVSASFRLFFLSFVSSSLSRSPSLASCLSPLLMCISLSMIITSSATPPPPFSPPN